MSVPDFFERLESHAVFRPTGEVSLERAVQLITSAILFAREQNLRKLMVVTSALTGFASPSVTARYFFVKEWAEAARGVVQVAVVARSEMIHPQKFGTIVAMNSGLNADAFLSEAEALTWLQGGGVKQNAPHALVRA